MKAVHLKLLILLIVLSEGCRGDGSLDNTAVRARTPDLPGNPYNGESAPPGPPPQVSCSPATAAALARVKRVGDQVVSANKQLGIRPQFMTAVLPTPEIAHQGTNLVLLTEALANSCSTDGQLAAVLSVELGKMIAEREAQASAQRRLRDRPLSNSVPMDSTSRITGSPDHTEAAEMAKMYGTTIPTAAPTAPLNPEVLARSYLVQAGFAEADLDSVRDLLKTADGNNILQQSIGSVQRHR